MNPKIKTAARFVRNLIFIPRCAICDERLSPIPERREGPLRGKICFCKDCTGKWLSARAESCPVCSNTSDKCNCTPNYFFKFQPEIPSLCFYRPDSGTSHSKVILTMKHRLDYELFDFMAEELAERLDITLKKMNISGKDCIFTWIPRKNSAIAENGLDQAKCLSKRMAKLEGAIYCPLLIRTGGKEQKNLDRRKRKKNAKNSIKLNAALKRFPRDKTSTSVNEFILGKTVIVIDDVMTSGATLMQASEIIRAAGASRCIVACIAKDAKKTDPKSN